MSCTDPESIRTLEKKLVEASSSRRNFPEMASRVPDSWVKLMEAVKQLPSEMPIVRRESFNAVMQEKCSFESSESLSEAVDFLHQAGPQPFIVSFDVLPQCMRR